jgi:cyclopropane fatty-acyl-phospholipid synthase-like methyltransferase
MRHYSAAEIRRYYDRHTAAFVALGQGGRVGAIHRAVWGPGVRSRDQAFRYVEDLIAARIRLQIATGASARILDLGCGVGASLCYLAERVPSITGAGITISPVQARLAAERIERAGLAGRVVCIEGDYSEVSLAQIAEQVRLASAEVRLKPDSTHDTTEIRPEPDRTSDLAYDVVYAIEAFVHGPDPRRFLAQCHALLRQDGVLIVCDDFRRATSDRAAMPTLERFRRGWHINTLITAEELKSIAAEAGFEHESTIDLSRYLQLNRARDRAIDLLMAPLRWMRIDWRGVDHLAGGSALQRCLARGWVGYDIATFRRC